MPLPLLPQGNSRQHTLMGGWVTSIFFLGAMEKNLSLAGNLTPAAQPVLFG
jgi:hypothetical protein